jgi:hypothetical protein
MLIVERVYTRDFLQLDASVRPTEQPATNVGDIYALSPRVNLSTPLKPHATLTLNHIHARASWSVLLPLTFFPLEACLLNFLCFYHQKSSAQPHFCAQ